MRHSAKLGLFFFVFTSASFLFSQENKASDSNAAPLDTTYCDISKDPAAYNHKLVRLTAFVTHGFEDFQLADPECQAQDFSVWVMYGGKAISNTMYCCPGEGGAAAREKPLIVEDVEIPLVDDARFREFTALLKKEPETTVKTTIIGRYFSGEKHTIQGRTLWGGYGHLGCCSLIVVQKIESFEPHTRSDLDYSAQGGGSAEWRTRYSSPAARQSL